MSMEVKNGHCRSASLWDGDAYRFFRIASLFGWWLSGEGDGYKSGYGGNGRDVCGAGCKGGLT